MFSPRTIKLLIDVEQFRYVLTIDVGSISVGNKLPIPVKAFNKEDLPALKPPATAIFKLAKTSVNKESFR